MSADVNVLDKIVNESIDRLVKAALEQEAFRIEDFEVLQSVFNEEDLHAPLYRNLECMREIWYLRGMADGQDITVIQLLDETKLWERWTRTS